MAGLEKYFECFMDQRGFEREVKVVVKDFPQASDITGEVEMPFIEMKDMGLEGDLR